MVDRRGNPDWAQQRIAKALAEALGTWVDPCCVKMFPARGYWAHTHQDCQRWTGNAEVNGQTYTLGSWGMTVSAIKMGERFEVHDHRGEDRAYSDFSFERPEKEGRMKDAEATDYDRGRVAFGRGEPLSNCPRIADKTAMHEWRMGWIDAKKGVTRAEGDYLAHLDSLEPNAGAAR